MQNFSIDRNEVLRYMGYKGQTISADLNCVIDEIIADALITAKPKQIYAIYKISADNNEIKLINSTMVLKGKDIYNHLFKAKSCAVIAVTLGSAFENKLRQLSRSEITKAIIFDAVGDALIEKVADLCEDEIKANLMPKKLYTNWRYSPGYGDFPLDTQQNIIESLSCEKRIGLTVTQNNIMIPRKSVTAFIGIFDEKQEKRNKRCEDCSMFKTCKLRGEGGCGYNK